LIVELEKVIAKVPGVIRVGPERRKVTKANVERRRQHEMARVKSGDTNGGAKITLSLNVIINAVVLASLLGAAGYATTKLSTIPSPDMIGKIELRLTDIEKTRETSNLRMLAMEKDVTRLTLDMQDIKNTLKEMERLLRRSTEARVPR